MFEHVTVTQMTPHVWLFDEDHSATGYLVVGSSLAMVIDTMCGKENLYDIVRTITDLPVIVVNTHGHGDHIGGNWAFKTVYLNPADLPIVMEMLDEPEVKQLIEKEKLAFPEFLPIRGGDVFDLGGLTCEIIDLPGHTPGGICVLLKEERILFTGDGINRHLWMQLDHSLKLTELVESLNKIEWVTEKADRILHGHTQKFDDISLLHVLKDSALELINQKDHEVSDADEPYEWFGGVDKMHLMTDKMGCICYRLDKLPG